VYNIIVNLQKWGSSDFFISGFFYVRSYGVRSYGLQIMEKEPHRHSKFYQISQESAPETLDCYHRTQIVNNKLDYSDMPGLKKPTDIQLFIVKS
jgi:hypothetical protein